MLKTVSSITNAIGALNFKGTWDANANSPALASSVGTKGDYYVVGTAGSTNLNGISNWGVGDLATFNGSSWQRVEGGADLNGVNLSVSGTSTLSNLTASTALALNASKEIVSVTNTGTGNNVLATSPTVTTAVLSGVTTIASGGSGGIVGNDDASFIVLGASSTGGAAAVYMSGSTRGGGNASNMSFGATGFQVYNSIFSALTWEIQGGGNMAPGADAAFSCGTAAKRWSVIFSSTPTINTSDANQKQNIEELDEVEKRVAVRLKSLIKKFKFKDAVQQKGDAARIHVGVIAQDVQAAFEAEGLDATRYGVFCSDTWWEAPVEKVLRDATPATDDTPARDEIKVTVIETVPEGTPNAVQKTQLGVRYDQIFSFVISSL